MLLWSEEAGPPRQEFFNWTDDGDLAALRFNTRRIQFIARRGETLAIWQATFVSPRMNPRADPFEDADLSSSRYPG